MMGGFSGLERSDFQQFPPWEDIMVLKTLIFGYFYFRMLWCLERTDCR